MERCRNRNIGMNSSWGFEVVLVVEVARMGEGVFGVLDTGRMDAMMGAMEGSDRLVQRRTKIIGRDS